jgi:hypothetical protein
MSGTGGSCFDGERFKSTARFERTLGCKNKADETASKLTALLNKTTHRSSCRVFDKADFHGAILGDVCAI